MVATSHGPNIQQNFDDGPSKCTSESASSIRRDLIFTPKQQACTSPYAVLTNVVPARWSGIILPFFALLNYYFIYSFRK